MKQKVLIVKDLSNFLEIIIQPILKTPRALLSNKKYKHIGLSPREILGLFLVCAVGKHIRRFIKNEDWTIASDPDNYDGVIICQSGTREHEGFAVEQVYIPPFEKGNLTDLVISRIEKKSSKGKEYGKNRHLVVFCDKPGLLDHQKVKSSIANKTEFLSYWILAKMSEGGFQYIILTLKTVTDPIMAYQVTLGEDFKSWDVNELGKL